MSAERLREWSKFLQECRQYFIDRNYTEVSTNYIVEAGAIESCLDSLKVSWREGRGELHTSPEIEMKRVLCELRSPIYQIAKCFRDDPTTPIHRREFHMLEFYLTDANVAQLETATCEFLQLMVGRNLTFERHSIFDLFQKYTSIDLSAVSELSAFRQAVQANTQVALSANDQWDDIFFKVMLDCIEPRFNPEIPTLVYDYPASQGVLSELDARGRALRFEIYWKQMELCNGCQELRDPAELRQRLQLENAKRVHDGKTPHPEPTAFLATLEKMPVAAGVAIGLDRLFRAKTGWELP